jgi:predicted Zn-dependent peptidase
MELSKLKNYNGTYLYKDEGFNTFSINLNFLGSRDNRSAAILDVLTIYLLRCNQVYKTDDEINLKSRELYDMSIYFTTKWNGNQKIFSLVADLISMDAINDDYSKEAFAFIRDMLLKPDFENEEVLEISKKKLISYIELSLANYDQYAETLYNQTVLPDKDRKYDYSVDKKYIEKLINSITLDDLKREYENLMSNYISGLVLGNINENQFDEFVKYMNLKSTQHDLDYSMDVKTTEGNFEVEKDCEQSYIFVTYDFTELTNAELRILEWILNSSIGLCYKTLREKYGLVYGSYAEILFHEKKLFIYGETDASKKEKFIEAVDEIIKSLANREIIEEYMQQAKDEIANDEYSLSESKDRMTSIINSRILKIYGNQDREIVNKEIQEMQPEELMTKTKTLTKKNVFMLRGKTNE